MSADVCELLATLNIPSIVVTDQVTDIVGNLEFAIGTGTLGVNNPFRYTFTVEVSE